MAKKPMESLKFQSKQGFVLIKGEVNGIIGDFILDTGASDLYINEKVDNPSSNDKIATINSEVYSKNTQIDHFSLGNLSFTNIPASIIDLSHIEQLLGFKINGLVGSSILKQFSLYIDYDHKVVEFYENVNRIDLDNTASYHISTLDILHDQPIPLIEVKIDKSTFLFGFDTGANYNLVDDNLMEQAATNHSTLNNLKIGSISFEGISFQKENLDHLNNHLDVKIDGILSPDILNLSKVFINYSRMKISFFWRK